MSDLLQENSRLKEQLAREREARQQAEARLLSKDAQPPGRPAPTQAEPAQPQPEDAHHGALQASEAQLQAIFEHAVDGIVVIDARGTIEGFNPAAETLFGYASDEICGQNVRELMPEPYHTEHDSYISNYLTTGEKKVIGIGREVTGKRKDGSTFPMELAVGEMQIGKQRKFTGIVRDITARHEAEVRLRKLNQSLDQQARNTRLAMEDLKDVQEQLIQAEKLASLGELVAGITHEVSTPIGIAVTAASALKGDAQKVAALVREGKLTRSSLDDFAQTSSETADMILSNLDRAADLMLSFKQVAVDRTTSDLREVPMASYLAEVILSLRPSLKKTSHQVHLDCDTDIKVKTQPGALSQVITNLVMNSLLHGLQDTEQGEIRIAVCESPGGIDIAYSDNGCGMSAEVLERIFDPFFTTRRGSGGTGLGMHIVLNLVQTKLMGTIKINSKPGQGARFDIHVADMGATSRKEE